MTSRVSSCCRCCERTGTCPAARTVTCDRPLLQIKPGLDEETFAKKEWPIFFQLLEQCYREKAHEIKRIKFSDIFTVQVQHVAPSPPSPPAAS